MLLLRTINALCKISTSVQHHLRLHSFPVESHMQLVLGNISSILSCNEQTALKVYENFPNIRSMAALSRMKQNIKLLTDNGVSKQQIGDNPFLLNLELDALQRKLEIIKRMQPRHVDDFVPLLDMREPILRDVAEMTAMEYDLIPEKNRIYYLSRELKIAPVTVSKYCSKFKLIFFASFTGVARKLNILLDYNVDGKQILQSLYIFRCADNIFISRLEELLSNGLFDIKLWFFKLTNEQFHKIVKSEANNAPAVPSFELIQKFKKRNLEKMTILNELNLLLSCNDKQSAQIYYNFINNIEQLPLAKQNVQLLVGNGASLEFIRRNSVVLSLPHDQIGENIKLIKEMTPNSIEDFLPLVEVDTAKLKAFTCKVSKRRMDEDHPIYFFSRKLNVAPAIVSKYFAKHAKSFFKDFVTLKKKLDLLVGYNVQPMSILQSPLTFDMSLETLETTLNGFRSQGIENISSWMLVCDTSRMERFVARRVEEKKSFGESANTVEYVAKRLSWDTTAKEKALKYYPPLAKCSVIKVKAHLDYLLNETHFTINDISSNVSVFRTNLDELKLRVNELTAIGFVPRKLYVICLDKKRYLEMLWKFCKKKNCPTAFEAFKSIEKRIKK